MAVSPKAKPENPRGFQPLCPPPVSAKILRIFGRGDCKVSIFALENEIFRRKNSPGGKPKSLISLCRSRSDLLALRASNLPAVHAAGHDFTSRGLWPSRALPRGNRRDGRKTLILRASLDSAGILRYTLNKIPYGKPKRRRRRGRRSLNSQRSGGGCEPRNLSAQVCSFRAGRKKAPPWSN